MKICSGLLSFLFITLLTLPAAHADSMAALFSPEDRPTTKLLELINGAKKSIHAAVYFLTDKVIAQALIDAKKQRKVDVKIILDCLSADPKYGKADLLAENGIEAFIFNPKMKIYRRHSNDRWGFNGPIMHHKFAIFDEALLWTGSFNWTGSANTQNCENVLITDNRDICKQYEHYHATLLAKRCYKHVAAGKKRESSSLRKNILIALESSKDDAALLEKLVLMMQQ